MSIKGYIIEKYNNMKNAYTCGRLVEEAEKVGVNLKIIGVHDTIKTNEVLFNDGKELEQRDFAINRYKWGKLKYEINRLTKKNYNNLNTYNLYINKYEQVARLNSDGFNLPRYVLGTGKTNYNFLTSTLKVPFVAKGLESSMGEQVFLISNYYDFQKLEEKYGIDKEWLFEEFITTSYGRDIRFFSIRGNVIACMQRKSNNDFRANVALGASVEPYKVTDNIKTIAKDIYNQTGLDFLGIDLLFGESKPYFCEINVMPGIEGIELATGVNVAAEVIKTIKEDFKNE